MAKTYDATLKHLVDQFAPDWTGFLCRHLDLPAGTTAEPVDTDLSSVTLEADKLFRLSDPPGGFLHLELESAWAGEIPGRLLRYCVAIEEKYGGPVYSVVILLRPEANAAAVTGELIRTNRRRQYLSFHYDVIRLWEESSAELIAGPVGTLPLALLTNDAEPRLPALVQKMDERLKQELGSGKGAELVRSAGYILLGLRYDDEMIDRLFAGVTPMLEQSSTYQKILRDGRKQGRLEGQRDALVMIGRQRVLGTPTPEVESALKSIADPDRLEQLLETLDTVKTWEELLQR